ncbi:proline iminopeptidase-family hydrolase [Haliangium sp.]|uniref:proline iminopeptidase-family hydrolase n=1 Tax=Haliangium sp. TaxID=2663208 RepID=UPI003D0E3CBE
MISKSPIAAGVLAVVVVAACAPAPTASTPNGPAAPAEPAASADCAARGPTAAYYDDRTPGEIQTGGVRMIELRDGHEVWTRRTGNSPMKVLLLHGGPALTHEYMECFASFFPQAGIEFYLYDQLGSSYSDQPEDMSLWTVERFVDEVEQVRQALGLNRDNFYLLGHSWGGLLAMEYALVHQEHIKGLIISNMTADFGKYAAYNAKLRSALDPDVLSRLGEYEARGDFHDPEYQQLVVDSYYGEHICRLEQWPEPMARSFEHLNQVVYEYMQGPSEFVPGGILQGWSVWDRLGEIEVPTLTIGAAHDSMDPAEMKQMSELVQRGRYLHCPNGSHMAMWDDQEVYMRGVIQFIQDVHAGAFP